MARQAAMLTGILGVVLVALGAWVAASWVLQRAALFPRPPAAPVSPAAHRSDRASAGSMRGCRWSAVSRAWV